MNISGTSNDLLNTALTSAGGSTPSGGAGGLQDQFLQLLVAQLQHQDPLQPQSGAEFVQQLAQLASLEQSTQTNKSLAAIQSAQDAVARTNLTSLVGRSVSARTDSVIMPAQGAAPAIAVHLDASAAKVKIKITDAAGKVVRTVDAGPRGAGDAAIAWDGRTDQGTLLSPGTYKVSIEATSASGSTVNAQSVLRGLVSALEFGPSGEPRLRIGDVTVSPADILSVNA